MLPLVSPAPTDAPGTGGPHWFLTGPFQAKRSVELSGHLKDLCKASQFDKCSRHRGVFLLGGQLCTRHGSDSLPGVGLGQACGHMVPSTVISVVFKFKVAEP